MHRLFALALLAMPTVVYATGFGGGDAPTRIPVPARLFDASVEDQKGTVVEVSRASLGGEVYLHGKVGDADVAVPFEKIAEIRVEPSGEAAKRVAFATLRTGETVSVTVDDDLAFWGSATFGNYKIEILNVRKISFRPAAP